MKLAKKMLACAMALAMVAALALTAFAAPAIEMTATDAVVGKTITVTVAAKDIAGLESGDLELQYDASALKFVDVVANDKGGFTPAAGNPEAGLVTFSFMYLNAATDANADFMTVTFEVLKAGSTDIKAVIGSFDGVDAVEDLVVTVVAEEAPTEDTEVTPPADEEPTTKKELPQAGEAGVAAIAGVMAIAAVAFVATRKKDEE